MEKMSLPIAYAMKKNSGRHMCEGGGCEHSSHFAEGGKVDGEAYKGDRLTGCKNARTYSEQGEQKGINTPRSPYPRSKESYGESSAGYSAKGGLNEQAKAQHRETLSEMQSMKKPKLMAEGGSVEGEDDSIHPMVRRIMMGRAQGYSEGGRVANEGEDELDHMADGKPNEFDDLVLDDHLEGTNSGAADGDSIGDAQEDDDRSDIVARIMKSRSKKDRMPRPA